VERLLIARAFAGIVLKKENNMRPHNLKKSRAGKIIFYIRRFATFHGVFFLLAKK
jgi:hypothetical protein